MRPHKGRRARAAVQILVAAAHGVVGISTQQVHRHGAGAVAQVPHAQDAARVRPRGHRRHVVHGAGAVVHVGQQQDGRVVRQVGIDLLGLHQHQRQAVLLACRLGDVQVGGEIAALADDAGAARPVLARHAGGRRQHLVQIDGGGVGEYHLARTGADPRGELVAQACRQVHPAGLVPRGDEALAPFALHHLGHARGRGAGQGAQGIAVQVNGALGQGEVLAQAAQRVLRIMCAAVLQGGGHQGAFTIVLLASSAWAASAGGRFHSNFIQSARSTARTGEASAVVSFRGRAISS